ncbi:MAG TPA: DUF465 domain-containing protein [Sphingopyxis sp.]|nr:DUF465 domain-containing protein [Sphingopyxis sp.]
MPSLASVNMDELAQRLKLLRDEHRELDGAILALSEAVVPDMMQIARLKKDKLRLRDEISWYEDQLLPDIIA